MGEIYGDGEWIKVPDDDEMLAEYNEQMLETTDGIVILYSDRDGSVWTYHLRTLSGLDGLDVELEATSEAEAKLEILSLLKKGEL